MGRRPADEMCGDNTWSAEAVARRLNIPVRRVRHLARNALLDARRSGQFRCFSVEEILTIAVAHRLATHGVKMARIQAACRHLRGKLRVVDGPLSRFTFFTDGKSVLVDTSNPQAVMDVSQGGQLVFAMALHDIVRSCHRAKFLSVADPPVDEISVRLRWKTARR